MLTFAGTLRAIDNFLQPHAASPTPISSRPVRFDASLSARLLQAHDRINALFASLVCLVDRDDTDAAAQATFECACRFQELRRDETLWLYPVIAHAIDGDDAARSRLMELRMAILALARRTQRSFDELAQTIQDHGAASEAVGRASASLAEYLRRSESEIYPLYNLVGARQSEPAANAA